MLPFPGHLQSWLQAAVLSVAKEASPAEVVVALHNYLRGRCTQVGAGLFRISLQWDNQMLWPEAETREI